MSAFYHRHGGGNHPHVHRDDEHDANHRHHHDHHGHEHDDHSHGHKHAHHSYDSNGHQPAIVLADPAELGHWHFEASFERITLASFYEYSFRWSLTDLAPIVELRCEIHLAPRPPPTPA
ncbi:MAG TPA: hypothetical protein VMU41_02095 [Candidatus Binataceae bacterium]|nr:hypothetical protein [Candidatus Binataceae bacterium]